MEPRRNSEARADNQKTSPGLLPPITERGHIDAGVKIDPKRGVTFSQRKKSHQPLKDMGIDFEKRPL